MLKSSLTQIHPACRPGVNIAWARTRSFLVSPFSWFLRWRLYPSHGSGTASVTLSARVFPDRGAIRVRWRKRASPGSAAPRDAGFVMAGVELDILVPDPCMQFVASLAVASTLMATSMPEHGRAGREGPLPGQRGGTVTR